MKTQEELINEIEQYKAKRESYKGRIAVVNKDIKALMDVKRKHSDEVKRVDGIISYLAQCLDNAIHHEKMGGEE